MRLSLLLPMLLLAACLPRTVPCEDHEGCPTHQGCLAGVCADATCRTSDDCAFGERCFELQCEPGCNVDRDCGAGQTCDDGTCADALCEDSTLDCPAGSRCLFDGTCSRQDDLCSPCTGLFDCADPDQQCVGFEGEQSFCLERCRTQADCPAAFSCTPIQSGLSVCLGDCAWLRDEGWL